MELIVSKHASKLSQKVLEASESIKFSDQLGGLDYGKDVALKAQLSLLTLLSKIDDNKAFEALHTKQHIHQGINQMFHVMYSNTPITSSPQDYQEREKFYEKLSKGFHFMSDLIHDEFQNGSMDIKSVSGCLDVIGDGGHACAGRWRQVLDELAISFSEKIQKKFGLEEMSGNKLDRMLNGLFYQSKLFATNKIAEEFVNVVYPDIHDSVRIHYTSFFKRFVNKAYHLNLSISMEQDPFLAREERYLGALAVRFLKARNIQNDIIGQFGSLFKQTVEKDKDALNTYTDYCKTLYHKNPDRDKFDDISDYLAKEVFIGYSYDVSAKGIANVLYEKGYIENEKVEIDALQEIHKRSSQNQLLKLEKFLRKLPEEFFQDERVKQSLSQKIDGIPLVSLAIKDSKMSLMSFLLEKGVDPNLRSDTGSTPLAFAVADGQVEMAELLIKKGSDVNGLNFNGNTPLMLSCVHYNQNMTKLLLENKANVNLANEDGNTPLMVATIVNNLELTKSLIEKKASVNIQNNAGFSPLMRAGHDNRFEIFKVLLENGADPKLKDFTGKTVLDMAKEKGNKEVCDFLKNHQSLSHKTTEPKLLGKRTFSFRGKKGKDSMELG